MTQADTPTTAARGLDGAILLSGGFLVSSDLAIALRLPRAGLGPLPVWTLQALAVVALAGAVVLRAALVAPRYAAVALAVVPLAALYAYTALVLPWNQLSFWLAQGLLEAVLRVPVVGKPLATALFGGFTLGRLTLALAALYHRGLTAALAVGLVARLGVFAARGVGR
jgi:quinol-cytochrome oxidoreductase complex cytochrome b subunit